MTAALPRREPGYTDVAANGCTAPGCGTQDTTHLCGCHGRRCEDHVEHHPYANRLMGGLEFCERDGERWPCAAVRETA